MIQIEKNKRLAEYLNIDFDKLPFSQKLDWHNDWNNLMNVANKLKEDTAYDCPLTFSHYHLSFIKEELFDNCLYFIDNIKNYNK